MKSTTLFLVLFLFSCSKENVNESNVEESLVAELQDALVHQNIFYSNEQLRFESKKIIDSYVEYNTDIYEKIVNFKKKIILKEANSNDSLYFNFISSLPKPECFNEQISSVEKSIFLTVINALSEKTSEEILLTIDCSILFVTQNICSNDKQQRLLYILSSLKYGLEQAIVKNELSNEESDLKIGNLYTPTVSLAVDTWESNWNRCMKKKYDGYNFVDWVQFSLNPAGDVLWNTGSCIWSVSF